MGWVGQLEFNASALARTLYILFGYSFHFGLTYACDTLLSQAFGKNKREMGIIIQRALLIGVNAILIEWIFLFNIQYLTKFLDKNDQVVKLTNEYLSFSIIVAPFEAISIIIQKFTINHGITWPILIINIIGNIVSIIVHYILLFVFHFGVRSPPIAFSCAYLVMILLCILYLRLSSVCEETWHPWTIDCFRKWPMYLKLGIPGVIVTFIQSLVYGGAVLLSTIYGQDAVTAQAVVFYIDFFLFLICLAFAVSSNIVIGRYLGSQQYERAEQAKNVVYTTALIIIFITTTFSFSVWYFIPYLFNTPPSAIKQTRYLLAIVIIFCAVDFYHLSQATILKSYLGSGYAKDSSNAFYAGNKIAGASSYLFEVLGDRYAKDAWYAFYASNKIEGSSGYSFEALGDRYAKDSSNAYYAGKKIAGASSYSFEALGDHYAKDSSNVYYAGNKIIGASSHSFEALGDQYAKDSSNAYYAGKKIVGASSYSFEALGNGYAKSSGNTYYMGEKVFNG
ncbi:unnamed protein product [Adineta steineri]|uniref:Multidrug and toxin extrusion protein n=1 Tax=Adineta steineri TaxID=433720 RepID=A0A814UFH9_9BILA|nr:unnamed protein product [Adineta steineri]